MDHLVGIAEDPYLPTESSDLRQYRSQCRSLDTQLKGIDKEGVEQGVEYHGEDGGIHRLLGFRGSPQHGVHTEIQMGEHIAQQDDHHVVTGIGNSVLSSAEEI